MVSCQRGGLCILGEDYSHRSWLVSYLPSLSDTWSVEWFLNVGFCHNWETIFVQQKNITHQSTNIPGGPFRYVVSVKYSDWEWAAAPSFSFWRTHSYLQPFQLWTETQELLFSIGKHQRASVGYYNLPVNFDSRALSTLHKGGLTFHPETQHQGEPSPAVESRYNRPVMTKMASWSENSLKGSILG